jgi:hypothetical protein
MHLPHWFIEHPCKMNVKSTLDVMNYHRFTTFFNDNSKLEMSWTIIVSWPFSMTTPNWRCHEPSSCHGLFQWQLQIETPNWWEEKCVQKKNHVIIKGTNKVWPNEMIEDFSSSNWMNNSSPLENLLIIIGQVAPSKKRTWAMCWSICLTLQIPIWWWKKHN